MSKKHIAILLTVIDMNKVTDHTYHELWENHIFVMKIPEIARQDIIDAIEKVKNKYEKS